VLRHKFKANKGGTILNMGSVLGFSPSPGILFCFDNIIVEVKSGEDGINSAFVS